MTANISTNSTRQLAFVMEKRYVFYRVPTELILYTITSFFN